MHGIRLRTAAVGRNFQLHTALVTSKAVADFGGADGFGFSDTRAAARRYFHIDGPSVVVRALQMLAKGGEIDASVAQEAAQKYRLLDVTAGTSGNAGGES